MKKTSAPKILPLPEKVHFQIPESFLNQLNEFCGGGYILIYVNQEGQPQVEAEADSPIVSLGLQKFSKDYFDSVDKFGKIDVSSYVDDILGLD